MYKFQELFNVLFYKYLKENVLTEIEASVLRKAIESVEIETLYSWCKPLIQEHFKEIKMDLNKKERESGFFKSFFGKNETDLPLISEEELKKIEQVLENSITSINNELMASKSAVFLRTEFQLDIGSFVFRNKIDNNNSAGLEFSYSHLNFAFKKGQFFYEITSQLKEFKIELVNQMAGIASKIPLTFKEKDMDQERDYTWKLKLRKSSLMEEIGTIFHLHFVTF